MPGATGPFAWGPYQGLFRSGVPCTLPGLFSTSPAWVSGVRHVYQRTVPEWILSLSLSGCWRTTDLHSDLPPSLVCPSEEENISSPTHKPETSQPSSHCMELLFEPTADGETEPAANEPFITTEPQTSSDQVLEPATSSVPVGGVRGLGEKPRPHYLDWGWAASGFWEL